jgi:acetyl esterase
MLDPTVRDALPRFFGTGRPPAADPVAGARAWLEHVAPHGPRASAEVASRDVVLTYGDRSVGARVYTPPDAGGPVLVFFHGGGWTAGSLATHDVICRALSSRLAAVVVSVEYRLAPEHPFPAALDDAFAATCATAQESGRYGGDGVAVAGDSAGANLATVVARMARERGIAIDGQLLFYPVTDLPSDRPSYRECETGYGLTRQSMELSFAAYLGGAQPADIADACPLRCGDLSGLAPAVILTAEFDVLRDEGEEYAERLRSSGVRVAAKRFPGLIHGFLRIAGEVDAAAAAFDEAIALVEDTLGIGGRAAGSRPSDVRLGEGKTSGVGRAVE